MELNSQGASGLYHFYVMNRESSRGAGHMSAFPIVRGETWKEHVAFSSSGYMYFKMCWPSVVCAFLWETPARDH